MNGVHLAIGAGAALAATGFLGKRGSQNRDSRWAIIDQGRRSDGAFVESLIKSVPFSGGLAVGRTREGILLPLDFSYSKGEATHLLSKKRKSAFSNVTIPFDQKTIEVVRSDKVEDEPAGTFNLRLVYEEMPKRTDYAILGEHDGAYYVVVKGDPMRVISERWHEIAPWNRYPPQQGL